MYPQQGLASNQPGFGGFPTTGHYPQGGYQQQNPWPQQGYQTPPFLQNYPHWFTQVTGQDISHIETSLGISIKNVLIQLSQQLGQAFPFPDLMQQNVEQNPEFHRLLKIARYIIISILVGKASKGIVQDASSAAYYAVIGAMVERIGGQHQHMFATIEMLLNIQLMPFHQQYVQAEQQCKRIIDEMNAIIMQNTNQSVYNVPMNNGYATARIAQSAMLNTNSTMGYGVPNAFPKPATPFDGVGEVSDGGADIYAMAHRRAVRANPTPLNQQYPDALPLNHAAPVSNTASSTNELVGGVMDPFMLRDTLRGTSTAPVSEPATSTRSVLPRRSTDGTSEVPVEGMPSMGHYEFGSNSFDPQRFRVAATLAEHNHFAPAPSHTLSGDSDEDEEDFLLGLQRESDALEQTIHEQNVGQGFADTQYNSLDEMLDQARTEGHVVKEPRLEVPYTDLNPKERQRLCREFRIRIVPAYLRGKSGLIQIAEGKIREVIIHRWEDVNYTEHETETAQSKTFASWDRAALDISAAKNILSAAATQDIWEEQFFLNKLAEKLEDNPQTEQDLLLSDLIADRQIIDIDDVIVTKTIEKDYVTEVIDELTSRGVSAAGVMLENSVIRYERFDSTMLHFQGENLELIETLRASSNAADIVVALNDFKLNSTIPIRESARLFERATKQVNRYLATEFTNGWSIESITGDYAELSEALIEHYEHIHDEQTVLDTLGAIYFNAVNFAFALRNIGQADGDDLQTVGTYSRIALVPFYYSQYPIDRLDQAGAIVKEEHPELYEFLNVVDVRDSCYEIKIVTLDNVVLTFCKTLGDDGLFFMVEKN
jgi:hypothetical protein